MLTHGRPPMARQRFIWPQLWDDPDLGQLDDGARLLYIGCFSLADDDGRLIGDPTYLKTQVFRYRKTTPAHVLKLRDQVADACSNFIVYHAAGIEYIAFENWSEYQKPKYPKPSKHPPPPKHRKRRKTSSPGRKPSRNGSGTPSGNDSSVGWVGLGSTKDPLPSTSREDKEDRKDGGVENGGTLIPITSVLKDMPA